MVPQVPREFMICVHCIIMKIALSAVHKYIIIYKVARLIIKVVFEQFRF